MLFRRKYYVLPADPFRRADKIFISFRPPFLLLSSILLPVNTVSVLFMINYAINWFLNPLIK